MPKIKITYLRKSELRCAKLKSSVKARSQNVFTLYGVMNGPLKIKKSQHTLPKARNLAEPTNGSRSLRFCVCWSHICFSIKSLNFSVSVSDFKVPVSASLGFTIRHPFFSDRDSNLIFTSNDHYHEILGSVQWLVKICY